MHQTKGTAFLVLLSLMAAGTGAARAEEGVLGHWLFDKAHVTDGKVKDLAGKADATIAGDISIVAAGAVEALELDAAKSSINVAADYKSAAFPKKDMTAEAWVRIDKPQPWGGIVGILQDNGSYEKGWSLGFINDKFSFAMNGTGGDGALTYLQAPEPLRRGQWCHVVGTYDGTDHHLYLNGKLVASSKAQTGDIDYPPNAFYEIGAYRDQDEFYRTSGALHEVLVHNRALTADEIKSRYDAKASKLPQPSPLRLPAIFGSHMVLQRDLGLPVWGWARPGDEITVTLAGSTATTKADEQGKWKAKLPSQKAGGPHELVVAGKKHRQTFKNVMIGEVWLCSGQSNMQWGVNASGNGPAEIAAAKHPNIRLFTVPNVMHAEPQTDCLGGWDVCSPETVGGFSAVGYYFGRELNQELNVPIGLINASWGGSVAEAWMSRPTLEADEDYQPILARAAGNLWHGTGMYNAMIHPVLPFAIRGAIWYHGESNSIRGYQYRKLFPDLIRDWRKNWGQGDFPFYYVQLCPFNRHHTEWPDLWEAQFKTLSVPNTGMAVTTDIGDIHNIHPPNKQDVGKRLALWALAKDYGKEDLVCSGPLYKSMKVEGDKIRITFDHAQGLKARDAQPLSWFTIAGEDKKFHSATATIDGETLLVHSEAVKNPVAVRFGWSSIATPNLVNAAGLPASPFRTDDWPAVTAGRN